MSEVWMAFECTWEDDYPLGVFSTHEKAEAACSEKRVERIFEKATTGENLNDVSRYNYYVKPVFIDDDTDRGGAIPLFPEK